ncbi:MAG: hypothetical protein BWK76_27955 [Desulfobulbaceae bacterium A2]|nr:MAG: hypothetical protein BWK76_27955 [Desulfobulbaceae bacterium A2]
MTNLPPIILWAARELLRQPGRHLLLFFALASVATVCAVPLLLTGGLAHSGAQVLEHAPALVLRRVQAGGWLPLDGDKARQLAAAVPGVLSARPRVWGLAGWQDRAVTVLGLEQEQITELTGSGIIAAPPAPGQALTGPGLAIAPGTTLTLRAAQELSLTAAAALPAGSAMVAHDLVLLHMDDARRLLGLQAHEASDLAVEVHHPAEEQALPADLAAAMPWPVRISGRSESLAALRGGLTRRGGLGFMVALPAMLALLLLVLGAARQQAGRWELGLLKALGWSSGDILRRHLWQGLLLGLPALALGLALAEMLACGSGGSLVAGWLLDWPGPAPQLVLDAATVFVPLALLGAALLLPWLTALVLPVVLAAADPLQLIRGELGEEALDDTTLPLDAGPDEKAGDKTTAPPVELLAAQDLCLERGAAREGSRLLDRVSLTATADAPVLITGATGAGKSSLLHILAGLQRPTSGEVWAEGQPVSRWLAGHRDRWRQRVGIVFQHALLLPDLTALENVMLPLLPHEHRLEMLRQRARQALTRCRIDHAAARPARLLSGGEAQRVALARALVVQPDWLFLDEPTAHQDNDGVAVVLDCLHEAARRGAAVMVVSHDPRLAEAPLFAQRYHLAGGRLSPSPFTLHPSPCAP